MAVITITDYLLDRYHAETVKRDSYPLDSPQRRDCEARIAKLGRQITAEREHQRGTDDDLPPAA